MNILDWDILDWVIFGLTAISVGLLSYLIYTACNIAVDYTQVDFKENEQYHITCYSPDLAITYMSVEPVTLPNEYGVWKFASGKGAYIQQSGDTCITQDVVEMPTQSIPE